MCLFETLVLQLFKYALCVVFKDGLFDTLILQLFKYTLCVVFKDGYILVV